MLLTLVRRGFTHQRLPAFPGLEQVSYRIGEPFSSAWSKAKGRAAEYVLLVDESVPCNERHLQVLLRILQAHPVLDGLTMDANALQSVYQLLPEPRRTTAVDWSVGELATLPSWLALLRAKRWDLRGQNALTPEFFLLGGGDRSVGRTFRPCFEMDAVDWAGDVLLGSLQSLAADYQRSAALGVGSVPRQFQVSIPADHGSGVVARALEKPAVFSILCPSIRPDFLKEAVDSVVAQQWPHWELLIGVDGPREAHLVAIQTMLTAYAQDSRVRPFYLAHEGTGPTRRRLATEATGDFVMAMDDDDRLPPHALARFAAAIESDPRAVALRGGLRVFGLFETYLPPRPRHVVGGIPNDIFEVNQPWLIRRNVLTALGGLDWDPSLKNAGEDSDLFLKVDRAHLPVLLVDEPLYERRLSTLNQTLDCTADECIDHVRTLYRRHAPTPWTLENISFRGQGELLEMLTEHHNPEDDATVVCATRFMDFQKLGSRKEVVLDLEITSLCNAQCAFCPREVLQRATRFMPLQVVERVAESLRNEGNSPLVMLCGIGESTLHPELSEVITILASAGAQVGMTTNGSTLSLALVDRLVAAGLGQLNISINAHTATTHATVMRLADFDGIVAVTREIVGLREQRWRNLRVNVSFVLTEANADEAESFVEFWRHSGVSQIWLHPLTNRAGSLNSACRPSDTRSIASHYAGDAMVQVDLFPAGHGGANACHIARGVDFISVSGDMLLCAQDYGASHNFGNVATSTLAELHHAKLLRHVRGESADICSGCTFCPPAFRQGRRGVVAVAQAGEPPS
jgi:MoaA/NifB/PqqE/SkfB family radical SAM enzyme